MCNRHRTSQDSHMLDSQYRKKEDLTSGRLSTARSNCVDRATLTQATGEISRLGNTVEYPRGAAGVAKAISFSVTVEELGHFLSASARPVWCACIWLLPGESWWCARLSFEILCNKTQLEQGPGRERLLGKWGNHPPL